MLAAAREARLHYASLSWNEVVGMRNRLVDNYFDVDLALLWTTVTEDLPLLIASLEPIVEPR